MGKLRLFSRFRKSWSPDDRAYIRRFTAGTCYYCSVGLPPYDWAIEHKTPLCRDGLERFDNIVPACTDCNRLKWTRTAEEFKKYLAEVVYWKLDAALDAVDIQERLGAPAAMLRRLRKAIDKAMDAAIEVDIEMRSRPFPGEAFVQEFERLQAERFEELMAKEEAEHSNDVQVSAMAATPN